MHWFNWVLIAAYLGACLFVCLWFKGARGDR